MEAQVDEVARVGFDALRCAGQRVALARASEGASKGAGDGVGADEKDAACGRCTNSNACTPICTKT